MNANANTNPTPAQIKINCQEFSRSLNHSSNGIGSNKPLKVLEIVAESGMHVLYIN